MARKNDDFIAEMRAHRARIQKQLGQTHETETETEPQIQDTQLEVMPETPRPSNPELVTQLEASPEPEPATEPRQPAEGPVRDLDRMAQTEAQSERITDAITAMAEAGSPMCEAGGWADLGDDLTAQIRELEERLFTAPEQASAAAHAACQEIASAVLDTLTARVAKVSTAWLSAIENDWKPIFGDAQLRDDTWHRAAAVLNQALRPAIVQTQSVVSAVGDIASRMTTSYPDLADPWKALTRDLRGRLAETTEFAAEAGHPDSAAHSLVLARVQAHARLAAMSPDERRRAAREAAIRRMSPADAAAARAADAAAEAAAKEQAEVEAAVAQWRTAGADLVQRYPLIRSIGAHGHRPVTELLRTAGLGVKTTTPRKNPDGSTTKLVSEQLPTLVAIADVVDGIELEFTPLPGQSVATWQSALGVLGVELGMTTLTVEQRGRRIVVGTHDVTPPEMPTKLTRTGPVPYDAVAGRSYLGQTETGDDACITWAGNSGLVVGGTPGSGKTASMLPVFAGMAGHAELHVFDGKAGFDLEPLRPIARTFDNSGDIDGQLVDVLERVEQLRVARSRALYTRTGISNFWNVPLQVRMEMALYPVVVVIDECQTWLDTSGMDKEERELGAVITKGIRQLIQKGRSSGIIVVLTTQKPDAKSIPTVIRDNSGLRIAFKVTTREQGTTVLGVLPDDAPRPAEIPRSAKGRCITVAEDGGFDVVQTIYVTPHDITAALAETGPVPDQLAVAKRLLGN
ncbi:hypothetical protein [Rhodococcus sp. W8901]|uniref:hypothetical protein n=1 Tax=Rhodococcus sp. W8901 TaxID=2742603 RepID=UPI00158299A8|nr:hypothetical protein [Rhodococcus sp. W8901]QKT12155.1 hypothetical protein HUN07_16865 [Rhodococcus sp. W8901]